ncbi:MAG: hypothetical protein PHH28_07705 [Desulfuromonadaceae bacterium]|nr:hypothetical protein [Desulfuromonadaceae bacterium]
MEFKNMISSDFIAAASALIAAFSAIYAYRSAAIAKKALFIAEQDFKSKQEKLFLYLVDAYKVPFSSEGKNLYAVAFNISITNRSSVTNSVRDIELEVKFIRSDDSVGTIVFTAKNTVPNSDETALPVPFNLPLPLEPKSAKAGWVIFLLPLELLKEKKIESYKVKAVDVHMEIATVEAYIIKEVRND